MTFDPLWEDLGTADLVPYPERLADVIAGKAYWDPDPGITLVGPSNMTVVYVRDLEIPDEAGEAAWRRHDPRHPRCWYCGKFTSLALKDWYQPPCRDCGEPIGGPW